MAGRDLQDEAPATSLKDPAEEKPFMSPHERRFGHEFLGLLLPLGAKDMFRPPTPVLKAQVKFAPRPLVGIFLG